MSSQTASVWLLLLVALVSANLPFLSQRLMAVIPLQKPKNLFIRLVELVVFYFLVGGLGLSLERHAGQIAPQEWWFYVTTAMFFITLAFPGFAYRYLLKHRA